MKTVKGVKVAYSHERFAELGFDGEIGQFMRENKNTAIVGDQFGKDRHVVIFNNDESLREYKKQLALNN